MRTPLFVGGFMLLGLTMSVGYAAGRAGPDQQFFEKHVNELVKVQAVPLDNPALDKVMAGKFFTLNLTVAQGIETEVVARLGDKIVQITLPSETAPIPGLKELVKPDFKLSSDADAHALQDVFDILYPVDSDGAKVKTIRHEGDTWTFVRGKFFEHLEGLIVKTDAKGTIESVSRSLEVK